jgi:hypothetical protein
MVPMSGRHSLTAKSGVRWTLAATVAVCTGGCSGCHDDHPFVPYSIGSSDGAAADGAAAAVAPAPSAAGRDAPDGGSAAVAPPGTTSWTLDGVTLQASAGQVFVLAIVADFDGDGAKDAFAIERSPDVSDWGHVAFYRGPALASPTLSVPPIGLSPGPTCQPVARLVRAGVRSVFAELGAICPVATGRDRWIALLEATKAPEAGPDPGAQVRLAATMIDPPGTPSLSADAQMSDLDGDGLDDVTLRVALEGGGAPLEPGPRVEVTFAWLQRYAGLSRERGVTEESFQALATSAAARAARAKDAPAVPAYVGQARSLWRAVCADGGTTRLVAVSGLGAIVCGTGRALGDLALAQVRAYVTMGDALRAALAFDEADRPPAMSTPLHLAEAQKQIAQIAPVMTARGVRAIAAVPRPHLGHEPAWGALAFEAGGKLLVRTVAGVVRVDPEAGDEAAAPGIDWKSSVTSPDGLLAWIEAYDPCDGLSLHATFAPTSGDDLREVPLPVRPPLAGRCVGSRGAQARVLPVAWGPGGLEAIVEGEPLLVSPDLAHASLLASFLDGPTQLGSPRSPDGKTYVLATRVGLVVRGPAGARILRARALEGTYGEQQDCVVDNSGTHVACVHDGKAWVGGWGP